MNANPTPWIVKAPKPARFPAYHIVDQNGVEVAQAPIFAAGSNAERIANSVNAYQPMLEALEEMAVYLKHGKPVPPTAITWQKVLEAIAIAKGERK